MRTCWGITIMLIMLLPACGTGSRLDERADGGGQFLPRVNEVDSGRIALGAGGVFLGEGSDLLLTDALSKTSIRLPDQTTVWTPDDYFDEDNNGLPDFIVLTIRPLSAHAAAGITAYDQLGNLVTPSLFDKVGGARFEPDTATFTPNVELTMGISSAAPENVGQSLDIYKFTSNYQVSRAPAFDIGSGTGIWRYYTTVAITESEGYEVVKFSASQLGEYAAVTDVPHDQGTGGDV